MWIIKLLIHIINHMFSSLAYIFRLNFPNYHLWQILNANSFKFKTNRSNLDFKYLKKPACSVFLSIIFVPFEVLIALLQRPIFVRVRSIFAISHE